MRNEGIRPAFACLKMVILLTVKITANSSAVSARPVFSMTSARDSVDLFIDSSSVSRQARFLADPNEWRLLYAMRVSARV
jgi:hypothetical protein